MCVTTKVCGELELLIPANLQCIVLGVLLIKQNNTEKDSTERFGLCQTLCASSCFFLVETQAVLNQ